MRVQTQQECIAPCSADGETVGRRDLTVMIHVLSAALCARAVIASDLHGQDRVYAGCSLADLAGCQGVVGIPDTWSHRLGMRCVNYNRDCAQ
jgi:hypothetical protein